MKKQETTETDSATKIDEAIKAAKAKQASGESAGEKPKKRRRLTPEERLERQRAYERGVAERKAAREKQKAEREAERERQRRENPAHMAKVRKAAEKLPAMTAAAKERFEGLTSNLTPAEIFVLAEHLELHVRAERTKQALETNLNVGDRVRIKSGHPRYVNREGTVSKAQRIRCFVDIEEADKPIYLFTSDVEVLERAQIETVPTDSDSEEEVEAPATAAG